MRQIFVSLARTHARTHEGTNGLLLSRSFSFSQNLSLSLSCFFSLSLSFSFFFFLFSLFSVTLRLSPQSSSQLLLFPFSIFSASLFSPEKKFCFVCVPNIEHPANGRASAECQVRFYSLSLSLSLSQWRKKEKEKKSDKPQRARAQSLRREINFFILILLPFLCCLCGWMRDRELCFLSFLC